MSPDPQSQHRNATEKRIHERWQPAYNAEPDAGLLAVFILILCRTIARNFQMELEDIFNLDEQKAELQESYDTRFVDPQWHRPLILLSHLFFSSNWRRFHLPLLQELQHRQEHPRARLARGAPPRNGAAPQRRRHHRPQRRQRRAALTELDAQARGLFSLRAPSRRRQVQVAARNRAAHPASPQLW